MLKVVALVGAVIVLVAVVFFFLTRPTPLAKATGGFHDLERYLRGLKLADNPDAFLVVTATDSEDFIQFKHAEESFEIDFPLVTDHQRAREDRIRSAAAHLGLRLVEREPEPGYRFLDLYTDSDSTDAASIVESLFERVFSVPPSHNLDFEWTGFEGK